MTMMKKKYLFIILLISISTFYLTGCKESKNNNLESVESVENNDSINNDDFIYEKEIIRTFKNYNETKESIHYTEEHNNVVYEGNLYFDNLKKNNDTNDYSVLYTGFLNKSEEKNEDNNYIKYIVKDFQNFEFAKKEPEIIYTEVKKGLEYTGTLSISKGEYNDETGKFDVIYSGIISTK
ncbi:MAG: hypothetical protein ACK5JH_17230 [Anaerocolumna sp.]